MVSSHAGRKVELSTDGGHPHVSASGALKSNDGGPRFGQVISLHALTFLSVCRSILAPATLHENDLAIFGVVCHGQTLPRVMQMTV